MLDDKILNCINNINRNHWLVNTYFVGSWGVGGGFQSSNIPYKHNSQISIHITQYQLSTTELHQ